MANFPDAGKITDAFFGEIILPQCGKQRPEVITGAQYGVDVSVISLPGGMAMALTSDPLTLIPSLGLKESAWLSVHILANDMVTTGFAPMYAQLVMNLPESITAPVFKEYWGYIHQYCEEIGMAITGGHTGQVVGQHSTVAGGGTFITVAPATDILTSNKAKPGNALIVTKECALTASAILAMSFPLTVQQKAGMEVYHAGCESFYRTSSLEDGLVAAGAGGVVAMHDVTEGGVLGAIYEMAMASRCGVTIEEAAIPVGAAQQSICNLFAIDPKYVVGAGSMIIAVEYEAKEQVLQQLHAHNIPAVIAGSFTEEKEGKIVVTANGKTALTHPGTDAYWNAFYQAIQKGWK